MQNGAKYDTLFQSVHGGSTLPSIFAAQVHVPARESALPDAGMMARILILSGGLSMSDLHTEISRRRTFAIIPQKLALLRDP